MTTKDKYIQKLEEYIASIKDDLDWENFELHEVTIEIGNELSSLKAQMEKEDPRNTVSEDAGMFMITENGPENVEPEPPKEDKGEKIVNKFLNHKFKTPPKEIGIKLKVRLSAGIYLTFHKELKLSLADCDNITEFVSQYMEEYASQFTTQRQVTDLREELIKFSRGCYGDEETCSHNVDLYLKNRQ